MILLHDSNFTNPFDLHHLVGQYHSIMSFINSLLFLSLIVLSGAFELENVCTGELIVECMLEENCVYLARADDRNINKMEFNR